MGPRIAVIDNYDSFVYILVQYLGELGAEPTVYRHDAVTVNEVKRLSPDGILISPGPGTPDDAGISNDLLAELSGQIPIFGVHRAGVRGLDRSGTRCDARQDISDHP